ncbi:hypothetical protein I6E46_10705 [Prevotella loescheii]|nr:hypothetical protein [Hoylesella loescheii]
MRGIDSGRRHSAVNKPASTPNSYQPLRQIHTSLYASINTSLYASINTSIIASLIPVSTQHHLSFIPASTPASTRPHPSLNPASSQHQPGLIPASTPFSTPAS